MTGFIMLRSWSRNNCIASGMESSPWKRCVINRDGSMRPQEMSAAMRSINSLPPPQPTPLIVLSPYPKPQLAGSMQMSWPPKKADRFTKVPPFFSMESPSFTESSAPPHTITESKGLPFSATMDSR